MRFALAAMFLLTAAAASAAPPPAAPPLQQYDVPARPPQTVMILTRDFAPGQSPGRHIHHGVEMAIVIKGEYELLMDGAPPHVYHAGESFVVPRDVPHDGKNSGATTTTLSITYVIDKGSPARIPVP